MLNRCSQKYIIMWSQVRFNTSILEPWRHLHVPGLSIHSLCRSFASYLAVKRTNISTHSSSACHLFFFLPFSVEKMEIFISLYYLRCALQLLVCQGQRTIRRVYTRHVYTTCWRFLVLQVRYACKTHASNTNVRDWSLLLLRLPLYSLHSLARACGVCGVVWCYVVWCGVVYHVVGTSRLVYSAAILTACRVTPVVHLCESLQSKLTFVLPQHPTPFFLSSFEQLQSVLLVAIAAATSVFAEKANLLVAKEVTNNQVVQDRDVVIKYTVFNTGNGAATEVRMFTLFIYIIYIIY